MPDKMTRPHDATVTVLRPGSGINGYAGSQERFRPFRRAIPDVERAVAELLTEQPPSFYDAFMLERIARQHWVPVATVRSVVLRAVSDGRVVLHDEDQVWGASSIAGEWAAIEAKAQPLLADGPILTFETIATTLNCTLQTVVTMVWSLCERDRAINGRYGQTFVGETTTNRRAAA